MTPQSHHFEIRNEVRSLTSFRFIAAFYVFLFHVQMRAPVFGDGMIGDFIAEGAVGMTMFFTLSGFILSHAYDTITIDLRAYFWNRVARIYPIYLLAAVLALPWLTKNLITEANSSSLIFALVAGGIVVLFGLLLIQAWLPQLFSLWNNSASWSISNEAFFYSLFPFLSDLLRTAGPRTLLVAFVGLCLLSSMIPASAIVFSNAPDSFALFYATPIFRFPEFVAGIVAYRLMRLSGWNDRLRYVLLFILVLGLTHVVILSPILPTYALHNWIFIPSVCAALVLIYKADTLGKSRLGVPAFVWLGQISYCFYSFQFHVLEGMRWMLPPDRVGNLGYAVIATGVLLAVSALAHHFVEEPARLWIRKRVSGVGSNKGVPN